ncbi:MAG: hypothetical protein GXP02_08835 [Alphaproteobacteria bacterium]|nr:hypothetical protein [Alphaproteobacteria bacterium]
MIGRDQTIAGQFIPRIGRLFRLTTMILLVSLYPLSGFAQAIGQATGQETGQRTGQGTGQRTGTVAVRFGDHDTFSRIVFDWQQQVQYRAKLKNHKLTIIFDNASIPEWGTLATDPMVYMADPRYRIRGRKLIVTLAVGKPGRLRVSRYGTKIAFDILGTAAGTAGTSARAARQPVIRQAIPDSTAESHVNFRPRSDGTSLKVTVRRTSHNISLNYPWQGEVAAAVFIRYNHLWVIFDAKKTVDQSDLNLFYGPRILSARQIDNPSMTILMYKVAPGQNVKVRKVGAEWYVSLENSRVLPMATIHSGQRPMIDHKGVQFFYALKDAGSVLRLRDPVVGDEIAVVPVMAVSQGVLQARKFVKFDSLATAQGIAITLIADNLNVDKTSDGISISSTDGLALSHSKFSEITGFALKPPPGMADSRKLVDFAKWAQGPLKGGDYHANEHELLYQLSNSTDANRDKARWRLARFYLANGRIRESYGVLTVMHEDEPKLLDSPEFRIVLAVTNILMRRFKAGDKLLHNKRLSTEKDAFLWRAVANDALGNYKRAFADYEKGSDILALYDPHNRIRFLFAATHSAYELSNNDFVEFSLSLLEKLPLSAAEMTRVDYWRAALDRDNGDPLKAEESLRKIVKAGVRQTAAWAEFDLINMDLKNKKITVPEAVDQFEKLRFSWRGDNFELKLLSRLGDLYVQEKEFNTGLRTLKLAVTFFKDSKETAALAKKMSLIYRDLFLKGGADTLDPIKAVALYSEFRELIPLGRDGDTMTRRLADRLVSLDLLGEAAKLLSHQVMFRLKGGAQSVVAARLAMIYLMDSKPEKALEILRATRDSQIPNDVQDHRRMIEGRALVELGRYEEAEVLIEGYNTPVAEDMRSDIYWKSKEWGKYIRHENRMLRRRYKDNAALNSTEQLSVLRLSVAYVMEKDKAGIKILRDKYKTRMDNGPYRDMFDVITAAQQRTGSDPRQLIKSIASVAGFETFIKSYKAEFGRKTTKK